MNPTPQATQARRLLLALTCSMAMAPAAWSQVKDTAPAKPEAADPARKPVPVESVEKSNPVLELSPFVVSTSKDAGYYAGNTLSGTRLNSKIEDLASSITVITKQQLIDTAAVDINDIFKTEASTEGIYQYTQWDQDRGYTIDTVAQNPNGANRVRGASQANIANGNFTSSVPIDAYNVDSVEISRGPNSNIFGLGATGGTVNIITGRANTADDSAQTVIRVDSYGGFRNTLNINKALIKDKLAIRLVTLYDEKGFERKPSYEKTNRLTGAITFRPFQKTTINASYESYHNYNNRTNSVTPRDTITDWKAAGSPVWDPTFNGIGGWRLLNGTTYTAVPVGAAARPNQDSGPNSLPVGLINPGTGFHNRSALFIDQGEFAFWTINRGTTTVGSPGAANSNLRYLYNAGFNQRNGFTGPNGVNYISKPLYQQAGISDQSLYDWESINFAAPNFGREKADSYKAELEQFFLENDRHVLAMQLGWYREDIDRYSRNFVGNTDGAPPTIVLDVNEKLLNGETNPFFLHPFIPTSEVQAFRQPEVNDNFRATLAYQIDLTKEKNWLKWLGRHRFAGYGEYRELRTITNRLRYRDQMVNGPYLTAANLANQATAGNFTHFASRYYLGGDVRQPGPMVDYNARWEDYHGTYPLTWYQPDGTKVVDQITIGETLFSVQNPQKREIRTKGLIWQSFLLNERVIPTYGIRSDSLNTVSGDNVGGDVTLGADGFPQPRFTFEDNRLPTSASGRTTSKGIVVKVLTHPNFSLNVHYNQSDNFFPEPAAYDIMQGFLPAAQRAALPNPTGNGKDYGFTVSTLNNKLSVRFNHYTTYGYNTRNGGATVFTTRPLRLDFDTNPTVSGDQQDLEDAALGWMTQIKYGQYTGISLGYNVATQLNGAISDIAGAVIRVGTAAAPNPTATSPIVATLSAAEAKALVQEAYTRFMGPGITSDYVDWVRTSGVTLADVNNVSSTGNEIEINYNPTSYWTVKANVTQQKAVDTSISKTIGEYIARRYDWWTTLRVPTDTLPGGGQVPNAGALWFTTGSGFTSAIPSEYYSANIDAGYAFLISNTGKRRNQSREYRVNLTTNLKLSGISDNKYLRKMSVGGSLRWEGKAIIGYKAKPAAVDGIERYLDSDQPIFDKGHYYVDLKAAYNFRFFRDKVRGSLQLNVVNAFEKGRLQAVAVNPDGTPWNFRIIDPRQFILQATFDL